MNAKRWNRREVCLRLQWLLANLLMVTSCGLTSLAFGQQSPTHPSATDPEHTTKSFAQPRSRFVQTPKASARCGPGPSFYATTHLIRGTPVEVYAETEDGWSGIRPTEGSHDWIPAESVYLLPGGKVAEVALDSVVAWIGSELSDEESLRFQTKLLKSQKVSVLGEAAREDGGVQKLWFRIAPPQGEFRWVRTSQLSDDPILKSSEAVQLAGYQQSPDGTGGGQVVLASGPPNAGHSNTGSGSEVDGVVVWSDEAEQLAAIERAIADEQKRIQNQTRPQSSTANMTNGAAKTSSASAYESDADYWNTMRDSTNALPKVSPMGGVLGWLGLSVVESTGVPVSQTPTPTAQAGAPSLLSGLRSSFLSDRMNPNSRFASRMERTPRNFEPSVFSQNNPSATVVADDNSLKSGANRFSNLLRSRGPLFGDAADSVNQPTAMDDFLPEAGTTSTGLDVYPAAYRKSGLDEGTRVGGMALNMSDVELGTPDRFETAAIQDALVQLSAMVSKPTEQWNLEPFRVTAKSWIELGETPLMRGEARLLLERVEQFESLRLRTLTTGTIPATLPSSPANPLTEAVPQRAAESGSQASGWLVTVHTSVPGQPEFALTDDAGKVIAYLRPTTGMNLRRYLQQPVTVYGQPGYLPNLAARQIIADRVVRLR